MKRAFILVLLALTFLTVITQCSEADMFEQVPLNDNVTIQEGTSSVISKHKPFIGVTVVGLCASIVATIITVVFGDQMSQMTMIFPFAFIIVIVVGYAAYHLHKSRRAALGYDLA